MILIKKNICQVNLVSIKKNKMRICKLIFVIAFLMPTILHSQNWKTLGPISNGIGTSAATHNLGIITAIWVDPADINHVFAGSNTSGLWEGKFNNTLGGIEWVNKTDILNLPSLGISGIIVKPSTNTIYISTNFDSYLHDRYFGYGLLRSVDNGITWQQASPSFKLKDGKAISVMTTDPNGSTIYSAVGKEIYKTDFNSGLTLGLITPADIEADEEITHIKFQPGNASTIFISTRKSKGGAKLLKSTDGGISWSNITPTFVSNALSISVDVTIANPNAVYLSYGYYDTRLYVAKSVDGGGNFVQKGSELFNFNYSFSMNKIFVSPLNENKLFLIATEVRRSLNEGASLLLVKDYFTMHADNRCAFWGTGTDDVLYIGDDGGVCKTTNSGGSWVDLNGFNLDNVQFHALGVQDAANKSIDYIAGGTQDNGSYVFKNNSWRYTFLNDAYDAVISKNNEDEILMFHFGNSASLSKSSNSGWAYSNISSNYSESSKARVNRKFQQLANNDVYYANQNIFKVSNFSPSGHTNITNLQTLTHQYPDPITGDNITINYNNTIRAFNICESNPNHIVWAYEDPIWGDPENLNPTFSRPVAHKFFRSTDGGITRQDLTANLRFFDQYQTHVYRNNVINEIIIDPANPNNIIVGLNHFQGTSVNPFSPAYPNLMKSVDGGQTWSEFSSGLGEYPIIRMRIAPNGYVFVSNDKGIFYKTHFNSTDDWQQLPQNNAPPLFITDMEFKTSFCTGKMDIIASTYGRGVWKIETPFPGYGARDITTNTTISTTLYENRNYYVAAGNKLTITGTINFASGKFIELEKGATLELNGGTLISNCGMWQGIIAKGDPTQSILPLNQPDPNHARVILKNNAKIQYAEVGIDAQNGAFVAIDNSNFIDNRVALKFSNYPSGYSTTPLGGVAQFYPLPYNNPSYAKNTNFTTQTIYLGVGGLSGNPTTFISIERNKGLSFTNCQFKNLEQLSTAISENQLGNGITSTDAGYTVTNCEFYHLNYGVSNGNTYIATFFPTIRNSRFNENLRGVLLQGGDVATVVSNTFTIEDLPVDVLDTKRYGLYLKGTHGYEVTNNVFRSLNGVSEGAGCIAWNTMRQSHFIKNNTFNNLTAGVISSGDNTSTSNPPKFFVPENYGTGLKVTCNTFNNTGTNIYVADGNNPNSQVITQAKGLSTFQGSCLNTGTTVNNLLDLNKNEVIFESTTVFRNLMYNEPVSNNQRYHLQSGKYTDGTMVSNGGAVKNVCLNLTQTMNPPCLTKIYNPLCLSCMKFELNTANSTTKGMVELVDGNNTNGLLQTINDPLKSDVQVRNELLAVSPYLSDEVLLATLNKTTPLHESFVKQIIIPNSPVSENVKPTLDNAIVGFSNGTKNQIIAAQTGVSERTLLESKVSQAYAYQSEVIYDMARFYLTDSLSNGIDSVILLLENSNNKVYSPWLTKLYIMKHDFVKADAILNDLQNQPEYQDFVKLMLIAKELEMSNRTCKDLTTIEKDDITNVSLGTCNYSKYNAEAWLKYYYDINGFVEYVELPTQTFARQAYNSSSDVSEYTKSQSYVETNVVPYEKILAKYQTSHSDFEKEKTKYIQNFFFDFNPNPAKSEINLTFFAAENFKTARFEILDMQGKTVITKDLSVDKEQNLQISVQGLKAASYVCNLIVDGKLIETKQLIKE